MWIPNVSRRSMPLVCSKRLRELVERERGY
jgi:hypothetical protein